MEQLTSLPPASEPEDALAAVVALRVMADRLERKAVRHAVEQGWTWAQIAQALGVTRQAAHKRHAAAIAQEQSSERPMDMSLLPKGET